MLGQEGGGCQRSGGGGDVSTRHVTNSGMVKSTLSAALVQLEHNRHEGLGVAAHGASSSSSSSAVPPTSSEASDPVRLALQQQRDPAAVLAALSQGQAGGVATAGAAHGGPPPLGSVEDPYWQSGVEYKRYQTPRTRYWESSCSEIEEPPSGAPQRPGQRAGPRAVYEASDAAQAQAVCGFGIKGMLPSWLDWLAPYLEPEPGSILCSVQQAAASGDAGGGILRHWDALVEVATDNFAPPEPLSQAATQHPAFQMRPQQMAYGAGAPQQQQGGLQLQEEVRGGPPPPLATVVEAANEGAADASHPAGSQLLARQQQQQEAMSQPQLQTAGPVHQAPPVEQLHQAPPLEQALASSGAPAHAGAALPQEAWPRPQPLGHAAGCDAPMHVGRLGVAMPMRARPQNMEAIRELPHHLSSATYDDVTRSVVEGVEAEAEPERPLPEPLALGLQVGSDVLPSIWSFGRIARGNLGLRSDDAPITAQAGYAESSGSRAKPGGVVPALVTEVRLQKAADPVQLRHLNAAIRAMRCPAAEELAQPFGVVPARLPHGTAGIWMAWSDPLGASAALSGPVEVQPLVEALREGSARSAQWRVKVARQLCGAVAALHATGRSHGSFGPRSVLVNPAGNACVVEAGLIDAMIGVGIFHEHEVLTYLGLDFVRYLAPEGWQVPRQMGRGADIWALGLVLLEVIGGARPPNSDCTTMAQLSAKMLPRRGQHTPMLPKDDSPLASMPHAARQLVQACFSPLPADRPEAEQLLVALLAPSGAEAAAPARMPSGWESAIDPESGDKYFANRETQEASWERPLRQPPPGASSASSTAAGPALQQRHVTPEPPPAHPGPFTEQPAAAPASMVEQPGRQTCSGGQALPEGWEEARDPSTGKIYFAHRRSGKSQWEVPVAPVVADTVPARTHSVESAASCHSRMTNLTNVGDMTVAARAPSVESAATCHSRMTNPGELATAAARAPSVESAASCYSRMTNPVDLSTSARVPSLDAAGALDARGHGAELTAARTQSLESAASLHQRLPAVAEGMPLHTVLSAPPPQAVEASQRLPLHGTDSAFSARQPSLESMPSGGFHQQTSLSLDPLVASRTHSLESASRAGADAFLGVRVPSVDTQGTGYHAPAVGNPQDGAATQRIAAQSGKQASSQLPEGWESVVDPSSGKVYYANRRTGESSWDMPALKVQSKPPAVAAAAPALQAPDSLPEGWETAVDPASGQVYYANRKTGQSSWTRPAAPAAGQAAPLPEQRQPWQQERRPSSPHRSQPPPGGYPADGGAEPPLRRPPSPPRSQPAVAAHHGHAEACKAAPAPPPAPSPEHLAAALVPTPSRAPAQRQQAPRDDGAPAPQAAALPESNSGAASASAPKRGSFSGLSGNFFGSVRQRMSFGRTAG
eukprot:TRINITY_DN41628_c0_g1_i1.p1 TRINITY_DN41628_c0_g1~~TRINITY_DN41628_c0_g1_i1.p1  ORF type:complete len:1389 (+),score=315.31 TRINITY_DN41628_c0_g1_i1:133-4299(+)